jgi:hypothetical protein
MKMHHLINDSWLGSFHSIPFTSKKTNLNGLSDNWCEQRWFMTEFDNQGNETKSTHHKQVFKKIRKLSYGLAKLSIDDRQRFPP